MNGLLLRLDCAGGRANIRLTTKMAGRRGNAPGPDTEV
jgi:hypothetical protein